MLPPSECAPCARVTIYVSLSAPYRCRRGGRGNQGVSAKAPAGERRGAGNGGRGARGRCPLPPLPAALRRSRCLPRAPSQPERAREGAAAGGGRQGRGGGKAREGGREAGRAGGRRGGPRERQAAGVFAALGRASMHSSSEPRRQQAARELRRRPSQRRPRSLPPANFASSPPGGPGARPGGPARPAAALSAAAAPGAAAAAPRLPGEQPAAPAAPQPRALGIARPDPRQGRGQQRRGRPRAAGGRPRLPREARRGAESAPRRVPRVLAAPGQRPDRASMGGAE